MLVSKQFLQVCKISKESEGFRGNHLLIWHGMTPLGSVNSYKNVSWLIHKYRQYKLGNPLKRPDMQFNTPGTLHCGKLSLNRDRLPTGTRRSWRSRFNLSSLKWCSLVCIAGYCLNFSFNYVEVHADNLDLVQSFFFIILWLYFQFKGSFDRIFA